MAAGGAQGAGLAVDAAGPVTGRRSTTVLSPTLTPTPLGILILVQQERWAYAIADRLQRLKYEFPETVKPGRNP